MAAHLLSTIVVGGIGALAQQSYGTGADIPSTDTAFEYHGCAVVKLEGFGDPIYLPDGVLTHESCQEACEGNQIVAIFADSCRCGNDAGAYVSTEESACDNPCMGDPSLGMCGSMCPDNGSEISTIFTMVEDPLQDPIIEEDPNPSISPIVGEEPSPIPFIPEPESQTIQAESPEQAQTTPPPAAPEIPAPEIPEAMPPSSTIVESDPGFINQAPEPIPTPPVPGRTIPTPAVVVSGASHKSLDAWLVLGGLFAVLMVAI